MEIDIVKKEIGGKSVAIATTQTTCDSCGQVLGSSYAKYGSLSVDFGDYPKFVSRSDMEDSSYGASTKHFCGVGCLGSFVDKKDSDDGVVHEYNDDEVKKAGVTQKEAHGRDISTKKRNHLKSGQFVDEKRRSFPIENCTDVHAAVHAWGRYKGSMSFDEFKAKLSRKAHELGCSLPATWTDKSGDKK